MDRKALFFDIDGTLLVDKTKELPESAAEAIRKARRAGHLIFINSGRARCLMQEVEDNLQVDGFLCGCGTYIEIEGRVALHHLIGKERRIQLQRSILDHGLDGILEGTYSCYANDNASHMPELETIKKAFFKSKRLLAAKWREEAVPFDKFCVLADENSDIGGFLNGLNPDITPIDRGGGLYECVPTGFDKATAMKFILDYYGIPWENSYAFGDSANDMAMIRYACNSVVMGQHDAALEPYASFITKSPEDDGIAYAFEKLHII